MNTTSFPSGLPTTSTSLFSLQSSSLSSLKRPAPLLSSESLIGQGSINTLGDGERVNEDDSIDAWANLLQQDCHKVSHFYEGKSRTFAA